MDNIKMRDDDIHSYIRTRRIVSWAILKLKFEAVPQHQPQCRPTACVKRYQEKWGQNLHLKSGQIRNAASGMYNVS
jgi:hypothetical protein